MRGANGALNLPILAHEVSCLVGEPVGIRNSRDGHIDHGGGDGWIPARQMGIPAQVRRCTLRYKRFAAP